jgi:arginine/lysine/ornithine decarboxylase
MTDSLYGRLKELENSDYYPFHMPGHKRSCLVEEPMSAWYSIDITEIDGFDNLHQPHSIIKQSQQKAAELYRADESWFLVNGSTVGILSALSSVADKGKRILIARNSHLSVYHGAYINDLSLIYLYPRIDNETGIAYGIEAEDIEDMLCRYEDIGAILLTSPTYEGMSSDILGIAERAHLREIPLIVDQAHGAHFGFHPSFPENAVDQGADIVIHSLHKTLPAPTQTALLHVSGHRVDRGRLARYLRIYQSSSPSYPLMAGIDLCLDWLREQGSEKMERLLLLHNDLTERVKKLHFLSIFEENNDPAKVVIMVKGMSGYRLATILREQYHLEMEMASESYVLAIVTAMDKPEGIVRLSQALIAIDQYLQTLKINDKRFEYQSCPLKTMTSIKDALDGRTEEVDLDRASNKVAADFILLYPPGIPLVVPGEQLISPVIEIIKRHWREGLGIQGISSEGKIKILFQEGILQRNN